jgi:hypothetical protein
MNEVADQSIRYCDGITNAGITNIVKSFTMLESLTLVVLEETMT